MLRDIFTTLMLAPARAEDLARSPHLGHLERVLRRRVDCGSRRTLAIAALLLFLMPDTHTKGNHNVENTE